jgi:hypothetical protein
MASKLKRTPLFGYDGSLGIPILPPQMKKQNKVRGSFKETIRRDFISWADALVHSALCPVSLHTVYALYSTVNKITVVPA